MTGTNAFSPGFHHKRRILVGLAGLGLAVPLVVACLLHPDPSGRGTHKQLGLEPCSALVLFGVPCPTCGMTTSWAHLVRGEVRAALRANAGGVLLCVLDVVLAAWLLCSAFRGHWIGGTPSSIAGAWLGGTVLVVTLIDWIVRLWAW